MKLARFDCISILTIVLIGNWLLPNHVWYSLAFYPNQIDASLPQRKSERATDKLIKKSHVCHSISVKSINCSSSSRPLPVANGNKLIDDLDPVIRTCIGIYIPYSRDVYLCKNYKMPIKTPSKLSSSCILHSCQRTTSSSNKIYYFHFISVYSCYDFFFLPFFFYLTILMV